ncbi:HD-GYP domain-containing protein [Bacillus sp. B1-b2]|uniref:HD-GYP domain-containing protein n=1 Tax=Bacillus sp. B1-b2 TaxID=2653201 RepID=UPI001261D9B9|nr:HD-GYP domain-containing protein [Bacillus sp. B1-b2]KAB7665311.1 HD-GYP domain-containing protein [Bacillus sp. B1-b2]
MDIHIADLKPGCILAEDIFKSTNRPIMKANTVINSEHIEFLKAFLIDQLVIENTLIDGSQFVKSMELPVAATNETKTPFFEKFLHSVQLYKKEFISWQSGLPVDISNVRNLLLPLLEDLDELSKELVSLYHLSNKMEYIYQHSVAVAIISALIAKKMDYSYGNIVQVALAGCLSDAGMAKINGRLLHKSEPLTEEEFNEVKNHTKYSLSMIPEHSLLKKETRLAIFQHHERIDGSGYPLGNVDNMIHSFAKIIAVADTFHAMTSERLYRKKQSPFRVIEKIQQDHFGKFDLIVVQTLCSAIMQFTTGSIVKLSNGEKAEIMFMEANSVRPLVKILDNDNILELERNRHLFIEEVIRY